MKKFNLFLFLILSLPSFSGISLQGAEVKAAAAEAVVAEENERSGMTYTRECISEQKWPVSLLYYYRSKEVPDKLREQIDSVFDAIIADSGKRAKLECFVDQKESMESREQAGNGIGFKLIVASIFTIDAIPGFIFKTNYISRWADPKVVEKNFVLGRILRADIINAVIRKNKIGGIKAHTKMAYFAKSKTLPGSMQAIVVESYIQESKCDDDTFNEGLQDLKEVDPALTADVGGLRNYIGNTIIDTEDFEGYFAQRYEQYAPMLKG